MESSRRSRALAAAAIGLGAVLFGWSLGGVASVDRDLQAALRASPATVTTQLVDERDGACLGGTRRERV